MQGTSASDYFPGDEGQLRPVNAAVALIALELSNMVHSTLATAAGSAAASIWMNLPNERCAANCRKNGISQNSPSNSADRFTHRFYDERGNPIMSIRRLGRSCDRLNILGDR
jgi:hypothetical protein